MKIEELTTTELRRAIRATQADLGSNAVEVRILRRELLRREQRAAILMEREREAAEQVCDIEKSNEQQPD